MTFKIVAYNLDTLQEKIEKLNKKAVKLGCAPIRVSVGEHYTEKVIVDGKSIVMAFVNCDIDGSAPKLNNYEVLAIVDTIEDENIVRLLPVAYDCGIDLSAYRNKIVCDHCAIARYRTSTYLLRNSESGEIKQVGSTCLKDFTGHTSPQTIARYAEMILLASTYAEESEDYGTGHSSYLLLQDYLEWAAASIRLYGFISKSKARETIGKILIPTYEDAFNIREYTQRHPYELSSLTSDDAMLVQNALNWIRTEDYDCTNEYMHTLSVVCRHSYIEVKHAAIAASLLATYIKAHQLKIYGKYEKKVSRFQGEVGQKITVEVECTKNIAYSNMYKRNGTCYINIMHDETGNCYVWKSSSYAMDEKDMLTITGTIKEHSVYNGTEQTVLTRCKCAVKSVE